MADSDIVFPVRRGERNEELRYALRSIANVPHGQVWIAGHRPGWVSKDVPHLDTRQTGTKYQNSLRNLLTACRHPQVSEEFILWNDDMFLLEPIDRIPVLHRGTLQEHVKAYHSLRHSLYVRGLAATRDILYALGHPDPLSYELHVPLPMTKEGTLLAHSLSTSVGIKTGAPQIKSLYGNVAGIGGDLHRDVKVFKMNDGWERPTDLPFISTIDPLWGKHPATLLLRELFPDPSPYERT